MNIVVKRYKNKNDLSFFKLEKTVFRHFIFQVGCVLAWWRVCLSMGIWFPPTTVPLTIFVFLFDCIC